MTDKNKRQLLARVLAVSRGKALIVRRSETSDRAGFWDIPGGFVEPGESLEAGAARELEEETGIKVSPHDLQFLNSASYEVKGEKRLSTLFMVEVEKTTVKLSSEHDDFAWIDSSNYHNYKMEAHFVSYFDNFFSSDEDAHAFAKVKEKNTTTMLKRDKLIAYTDGGSRGNPGPSSTGYVIMDEARQILIEGGEYLGITTNNQAEYQAVRTALEECQRLGAREVAFFIDSLLIVKQMSGEYKVKNRDLWPIHEKIKSLIESFENVTFTHVPREQNKLADAKVNEVLDNRK